MNSFKTQQLTHDGIWKFAPVYLNNGASIVYSVHTSPKLVALHQLDTKTGLSERLHGGVPDHQFDPAFSPDGRFHAYSMGATSPQLVLVIQDMEKKKQVIYRARNARAVARCPSIAPDNSRVAFTHSDEGGCQIASVNTEGKDLQYLTKSVGLNCWPAFSPDGSQIAFSSSRGGVFDIHVMNADGTSVRQLTSCPAMDVRPRWSPDGQHITFTSNRDGKYEIYIMDANGNGQRRLTTAGDRNDFASWHPKGNGLVVMSERNGRFDLFNIESPAA